MNAVDAVFVERLCTRAQKPISEPHRFSLLALCAFACISASLSFGFNLISGEMQSRYHLSQGDISTIATIGLVISYCVLPFGALYDHFGPRLIFVLSITLFPLGALLFALTFNGIIVGSVARLSVFNAMVSLGCTLFDLGSVMTVLSHFPSNRGVVVAIAKTFTGLGSAIVGSIQLAFFNNKPDNYFYFLMVFVFVVGMLCACFLKLPSYHLTGYEEGHLSPEEKERRLERKAVYLRQKPPLIRVVLGLTLLIALIVYLPLQSSLVAYLKLGRSYKVGLAIPVIVLTLLYPTIALPVQFLERRKSAEDMKNEPCSTDASKPDEEKQSAELETDVDYIAPQYQGTFLQNLRTLRMWAFLWSFFCIVGSEFVIILNTRYIFAALSGQPVDNALNTLLSVLSGVGSAVGRLLMSYFEIWSQRRKAEDRIPITISLFLPSTFVLISMLLFLVLPKAALPLPYAVAAIGNGFCAAVTILVTRTIFAKDSAKHYNFCFVATAFSTVLLNRLLYGEWYTREAKRRGELVCLHRRCVTVPLIILLSLTCTTFLTNTYIHLEYRKYCRKVLEERRRLREMEAGSVLRDTPMDGMSNPGEVTASA